MIVSVFVRRLKEGHTFEDFVSEWEADRGFGVPTRVFNAQSLDDPRDVGIYMTVAADDAGGSPGAPVEFELPAGAEVKGLQETAIVAVMAASSPSSSPDSARRSLTSTAMATRSSLAPTTLS
jgi:hypothetical protein